MIESATYTDGQRTATLSVERIDTWQEDTEVILNFPHVIELADNCLFMRFSRSQHAIADVEPKRDVFSTDDGETWGDPPPGMDFGGGSLGYLRDGTIMRLEHNTVEANRRTWDKHVGPFHLVMQEDDPTFRLRTWRSNGDPIDSLEFKIDGLPWDTASYQTYAKILDLDDGSLLAAMEAQVGPPRKTDEIRDDGRHRWAITMTTFIVRSRDRGRTWDFVTAFRPEELNLVYGGGDRPVDEGLTEADLIVAANGDILCVNRTGSYSPMWQTRSTDGGHTWGAPHPVGWQGVKPRLNLLPNGVLTCAAGRGGYGHPQVTHVMISLDGTGSHWEAPFCFHTGPGCSYTSTLVRDGQLHVVFSDSDFTRPFGTHNLPSQRIRRAVIDVRLHDS
ncbi:MAG: sialidase family protein [Chloroflexi bacterium]|nr:sialidase family protein [Chloroflexota bacterium]